MRHGSPRGRIARRSSTIGGAARCGRGGSRSGGNGRGGRRGNAGAGRSADVWRIGEIFIAGLVWPFDPTCRASRDRVHAWGPAGVITKAGAGRSRGPGKHGGRPYESTGAFPAEAQGGRASAVPGRRIGRASGRRANGWTEGRKAGRPAGQRDDGPLDRPRAEGMEAPEGTGGDLRSTGPAAANKSTVPSRRRVPRSLALRPANLVPGTVPRIAPRTGLAVQPAPSGKTKCTTQGRPATRPLSTNIGRDAPDLSPNLPALWTGCGYTHPGGVTWVVGSLDLSLRRTGGRGRSGTSISAG